MIECEVLSCLEAIHRLLRKINKRLNNMNEILVTLTDRVAEIENVADAMGKVLGNVKAALDKAIANNDMSMVSDLSNRLGAQSAEIVAITLANTIAEPDLPVEEPVVEEPVPAE